MIWNLKTSPHLISQVWVGFSVTILLFSAVGYAGNYFFLFDLFSHFQWHYAVILFICSTGLLVTRRYKTAFVIFLYTALIISNIYPFYVPSVTKIRLPLATKLKLLQANVYIDNLNYPKLDQLIQHYSPDVISLQEVNENWLKNLPSLKNYPYSIADSREELGTMGIALYSKYPLINSKIRYFVESANPASKKLPSLTGSLKIGSVLVNLISTHPLPTYSQWHLKTRNQQLLSIAKYSRQNSVKVPTIIIGDFNTTNWSPIFDQVERLSGLKNTMAGYGVQPTWHLSYLGDFWGGLLSLPIDHVLVSPEITVLRRETGPDVGSDHLPVYIELGIPQSKPKSPNRT